MEARQHAMCFTSRVVEKEHEETSFGGKKSNDERKAKGKGEHGYVLKKKTWREKAGCVWRDIRHSRQDVQSEKAFEAWHGWYRDIEKVGIGVDSEKWFER